jgi:tryptophan 2-monooxygenase
MSPAEVIMAATAVAADHLGLEDVGRLQAGAVADVVALRRSPIDDPAAFDDIAFVLAGGAVVGGELPPPSG